MKSLVINIFYLLNTGNTDVSCDSSSTLVRSGLVSRTESGVKICRFVVQVRLVVSFLRVIYEFFRRRPLGPVAVFLRAKRSEHGDREGSEEGELTPC